MRTVTLRSVERRRMVVRRFQLEISGSEARRIWSAQTDHAVIGAHPSADVVLKDKAVSRFHTEIKLLDDRVVIRDLGSRNGTRVDGVSIVEAHLEPGAAISIGRSKLRFDLAKDDIVLELADREHFGDLAGGSTAMRMVYAGLERVARTSSTVLLYGESGTGKELAARAIHAASPRALAPYQIINCAALPVGLIEAELFGHERGAFSGAVEARPGPFELAHAGTVLLDEIGELELELQAKLLRVLESGELRRVGGNETRRVDVRVIAASNRDLRAAVNAKTFRPDLYYRLAVVPIRLPPLRERLDDLPLLVAVIARELGAPDHPLVRDDKFLAGLRRHDWPGNVRELRNYVEASVALDAPAELGAGASPAVPLKRARREFEHDYLEAMLRRHDGNVSAAARAAGVDRVFFYRMLRRTGLR